MIAFLSVAVALVPLLMFPGWFLYFDAAPKVCVILITAGILLLLSARLRRGFAALWQARQGSWYLMLISLQIASILVSSFFSIDPTVSFFGTGWHRLGAVQDSAILIVSVSAAALITEVPSCMYVLLRWICGSGVLIASYTILQYLGWDPLGQPADYRTMVGPWLVVRPPGTLGHATHLGSFLVVTVSAAIALAASGQTRAWSWLARVCGVLSIIALLASGTRAAFLGAALMLVLFAVSARSVLTLHRVAVTFVVLASFFVLIMSPLGKGLRDRTSEGLWLDTTGGPRRILWRDSLRMASAHLLLGHGPEVFGGEFPRYQSAELASAYPDSYFESAHNTCLDTLISQGVAGMVLQLATLLLALSAAVRSNQPRSVTAAIAGGCIGVFAAQQFGSVVPATELMYQLTIAILVAASIQPGEEIRATCVPARIGALSLPAAAVFLVTAGQMLLVDTHWAAAQRALANRDPVRAMLQFEALEHYYPPDTGADLWYSRALLDATRVSADGALRARAWTDGMQAAGNAAVHWDNRANALYNLAAMYWAEGDLVRAESATQESLSCSPQWYKPHWLRAEILFALNQPEQARSETSVAIRLAGARAADLQLTRPGQLKANH